MWLSDRRKIEILGQIKCGVALSNNGYDRINDSFSLHRDEEFLVSLSKDDMSLEPQAADNDIIKDDDDLSVDEPTSSPSHVICRGGIHRPSIKKDGKQMFIEIDCCMNLKMSSGGRKLSLQECFGGKSEINPFVVIKVNDKEIGRTPTIKNTIEPFWVDQCFEFPVSEQCSVELEVWTVKIPKEIETMNASFRNEQLLGKASISISELQANQNGNLQDSIFDLKMEDEKSKIDQDPVGWSGLVYEGHDYRVPPPETLRLREELTKIVEQPDPFYSSTLFIAIVGTIGYYIIGIVAYSFVLEKFSVTDSMYFSIVTLTTVGYG